MGAITIRRLDDTVISRLKDKARSNNRSMEEEAREILTQGTAPPLRGQSAVDYFQRHQAATFGERVVADTTPVIRDMRYGDEEGGPSAP